MRTASALLFLTALTTATAHATPVRPAGDGEVYVWASGVRVRSCADTTSRCPAYPGVRLSRQWVRYYCQLQGGTVTDGRYQNNWWVEVIAGRYVGWVNAVYVRGGGNNQPVPGVPGPENCV